MFLSSENVTILLNLTCKPTSNDPCGIGGGILNQCVFVMIVDHPRLAHRVVSTSGYNKTLEPHRADFQSAGINSKKT